MRSNLVQARKESLKETSEWIGSALSQVATRGDPEPVLKDPDARAFIKSLSFTSSTRIRLYNPRQQVVADSYLLNDEVEGQRLPPIKEPGPLAKAWLDITRSFNSAVESLSPRNGAQAGDGAITGRRSPDRAARRRGGVRAFRRPGRARHLGDRTHSPRRRRGRRADA